MAFIGVARCQSISDILPDDVNLHTTNEIKKHTYESFAFKLDYRYPVKQWCPVFIHVFFNFFPTFFVAP